MRIGDRVKILTCPGHVWRGDIGTVIAVGSETLTVRKDGDPDDASPVHDHADRFELVDECRVKPAEVLDRAFDPEGGIGATGNGAEG